MGRRSPRGNTNGLRENAGPLVFFSILFGRCLRVQFSLSIQKFISQPISYCSRLQKSPCSSSRKRNERLPRIGSSLQLLPLSRRLSRSKIVNTSICVSMHLILMSSKLQQKWQFSINIRIQGLNCMHCRRFPFLTRLCLLLLKRTFRRRIIDFRVSVSSREFKRMRNVLVPF